MSGTVVPMATKDAGAKQPKHPVFKLNFARLRKSSGITKDDILKRMNVSSGAVDSWAKGKSLPGGDHIVRLAELLGCHPRELIDPPGPLARDERRPGRGR